MRYPMTAFIVKLLVLIAMGWIIGFILGTFMGSPEFAVGIFLLYSVSIKREVFKPSDL
jgi:hypothetical protein